MTRRYSVEEIDRMREATRRLWGLRGMQVVAPNQAMGPSHTEEEEAQQVELELRTYMMNGTRPEELEQAARRANEDLTRRMMEPGEEEDET